MATRTWLQRLRKHPLLTVATAALLMATAWLSRAIVPASGSGRQAFALLMIAAAIIAGIPIAKEAWGRLRGRQLSIPLLVTVAAIGAVWIGEAWEAAAVTFLYALGGYMETRTLARTRQALRSLVAAAPRTARVLRQGTLTIVPAASVEAGETVVVLPGDRVPVDGAVVDGWAALDTSALTGEPMPVEVAPGDQVMGGSVSQGGQIEVLAQRVGRDTTFSRLIHLVAEAQEQKPKVQRFLDRFARWYTPAIMLTAVAIYVFTTDARLALTFLVIGCPGALVMAAPVATVAGLGRAARQGILIKGGERLERIGRVDAVAFDKTGTLTAGRPRVTHAAAFTGDTRQMLALAAAAELRSEHHLATAILAHAEEAGVDPVAAWDWQLIPGRGARADSAVGELLVGNRALLTDAGIDLSPSAAAQVAAREALGETIALVAAAGVPVGLIGIADTLRADATGLVTALHRAGVKRTVMLTGDSQAAAARVAGQLGITEVRAGLLPAEKVAAIAELQREGYVTAMIGDGINDAPALAAADVSIAMGKSGTQVAIETADIVLMSDRLALVPEAIGLSRKIMTIIRQNVILAVAVVVLLLAGVVGRVVHLGSGMLIHEASVLLVIANGMRLLGGKAGQHNIAPPDHAPQPVHLRR